MNRYQKKYFYRAVKIAYWLRYIPYVRAVFLTGSVARGEARKKSDIDFFIVTKPGRIWTCRVLVTLAIGIVGLRRTNTQIEGRICLNRYQTEINLEIKPHNAYHRRDYSQAICLLDLDDVEEKYRKANKWIKKFKTHDFILRASNSESRSSRPASLHSGQARTIIEKSLKYTRKISETILSTKFGDWIELKLKKYQQKRILSDPRTLAAPRGKIIATDQALCFHPQKHLD